MIRNTIIVSSLVGSLLAIGTNSSSAENWPMWRHDAARSAASGAELPEDLHLLWTRKLPALEPAFHAQRLQFDAGYEPVVWGQMMVIASSRNDRVTAFDTTTGQEKWRFYADGPVRLAPVLTAEHVVFGADDGQLYFLRLSDGHLIRKVRIVPSQRKLLGNGRLISVWPVRGGPVWQDGIVYAAAGVWPTEGVYLTALDVQKTVAGEAGQVWLNDSLGAVYGSHPHDAVALGGISPQGYLVISGEKLIVPCGQAFPAKAALATGRLEAYSLPAERRKVGGWFASAAKRRGEVELDAQVNTDLHEGGKDQGPGTPDVRGTMRVGKRTLKFSDGYPGVDGEIHTVLTADDKLFVVTTDGEIYAFRADKPDSIARHDEKQQALPAPDVGFDARWQQVSKATGVKNGYAFVAGVDDPRWINRLITQTEMQVIGIGADAEKIAALRRRYDNAGLYGTRVAISAGDADDLQLPPYFASLAMFFDPPSASDLEILRPYGGVACCWISDKQHWQLAGTPAITKHFEISRDGEMTLLRRSGPLPGAVNYAGDFSSADKRVRAPLGVLWFDDRLSHFKRSPQPLFTDGLMVSYPKDWLAHLRPEKLNPPYALLPPVVSDVYTGRIVANDEVLVTRVKLPQRDQAERIKTARPAYQKNDFPPERLPAGTRINPLTGKEEPREIPKSYGCDGGVDYGHLYTMRSGTPAFYDKQLESGLCSISGPRSGCTNSIIPACGVLNVPYFYEGCTCSYPLPVGLAMVSMPPEYEQWATWGKGAAANVERVGVNFGAPGDRMTDDGTLWLEIPSRAGDSPPLDVKIEPADAEMYYRHSLMIRGGQGWPWVAASGVKGPKSITVAGLRSGKFTVRLAFADPDSHEIGERVFDVAINGKPVLENFDILRQAQGRERACVTQFQQIASDGKLTLTFTARHGTPLISGLEIIANNLPAGEIRTLPERQN